MTIEIETGKLAISPNLLEDISFLKHENALAEKESVLNSPYWIEELLGILLDLIKRHTVKG